MDKVTLSPRARKALVKIPDYIQIKLYGWAEEVERFGLEHVRTAKGYHDESLKGVRRGQRSIRLSRAYRAIYVVEKGEMRIIEILEVSKHKY